MIKFCCKGRSGETLIGLGLSHENLERLKKGQPISVEGKDIGLDGQNILIFSGSNEEAMAAELAPWITADTKLHGMLE